MSMLSAMWGIINVGLVVLMFYFVIAIIGALLSFRLDWNRAAGLH